MGISTQGHLFLEKIVFVILVNFFMKMKIFFVLVMINVEYNIAINLMLNVTLRKTLLLTISTLQILKLLEGYVNF